MKNLKDILKDISLFSSLDDSSVERLSQAVRPVSLKQGETLFFKGDEGNCMYIVRSGTIKIVLPSVVGEEIIVTLLKVNDFFGVMPMLDGEARSADAVSVTPAEVFVLGRIDFLTILQSDINALKTILFDLSQMVRRTDDLLGDLCFSPISVRLTKKLLELAETSGHMEGNIAYIDIPLTQKEIGDMVGATRESVNKELKILREGRLIEVNSNKISIVDVERMNLKALQF